MDCTCSRRPKEFIVRVKYENKIRFVRIARDELNITKFLKEAFKALHIEEEEKMQIQLSDNLATPISPEMFDDVIECFSNGSGFYINLFAQLALDDAKSMVTPDNLEKYLIEKNAGHIFVESKALGPEEYLSNKSRCQLVAHLVDFMYHVYKGKISKENKISTAKATVVLFPCLKFAGTKDGIDLLYNTANGGYIGQRMKNQRSAVKKRSSSGAFGESSDNTNFSNTDSYSESSGDEMSIDGTTSVNTDAKECFEDLKSIVVNDKNRSEIENKLKFSREFRKNLLTIKETDLLECFPYYFAHPKLILFEYSDTFPEVNANAFIESWPAYARGLQNLIQTHYSSSNFHTQWSEDIHNALILLKLLPPKFGNKTAENRDTFNDSIDKFIVFRPLGTTPDGMMVRGNNHPYIVAYGTSKRQISKFYIEVEKHVMAMPNDFGILETLDMLFKIHKIFDLNFEKNLKNMFCFIQNYIYKQTDKDLQPTNRMTEIINMLSL